MLFLLPALDTLRAPQHAPHSNKRKEVTHSNKRKEVSTIGNQPTNSKK